MNSNSTARRGRWFTRVEILMIAVIMLVLVVYCMFVDVFMRNGFCDQGEAMRQKVKTDFRCIESAVEF